MQGRRTYLVQSFHAFWLLSDDRSACSREPGGRLRALSVGHVRSLGRHAQAVGLAAMTPLCRRGRLDAFPIFVSNLPADSIHFSRANNATGGTFGFQLEYRSCELTTRCITSESAAPSPHSGLTNLPTTRFRCLKRPLKGMGRHFVMTNIPTHLARGAGGLAKRNPPIFCRGPRS